ncbi:UDP-N-acetylmuramate--L-alanine ligase [[Limnothrix rosea] IAM M-220]|uniref:UDP-N-acetylmuramate--L-alanine ligase n=1 Tax=[Limnothrix rosea] IAM M-220 TaxID=454133 RepID=UPI0009689ECF|nr:UDP-N-acetylmuramate--L-alanine ligase [[Limnothrix rosea] IAM M-220]OKH17878.1 UDP-N-acetylmuramate--L-alanine ligase [[Limnothrix rosea] IAM M-220]
MKTVDLNGKPFHFIGIGGIGMSALAYVLAQRNLPVSGSDQRSSHITQRLAGVGANIFNQQIKENLNHFDPTEKATAKLPQVICSTAIGTENPEFQAAQLLGCDIFHRSDVLSALVNEYDSVAVGGTHGKTTTSSLIGYILLEAGLDPTIIVGGEVDAWDGNARLGKSRYLVAEADESDGTLVKLNPKIGVVTNMELDHPDHYQSIDDVIETFRTFAGHCKSLVACLDCPMIASGSLNFDISYAIDNHSNADYWATDVVYGSAATTATIWEKGDRLGEINLSLLGKHNLNNALAAIAVARYFEVPFAPIAEALTTFGGAKRRFEVKGKRQGITFIDDYAHHPSEILVTLAAARLRAGKENRVIAVFQPHRYSRTATFLAEFATAFKDADLTVITDIYSAGEENIANLTGETLQQAIAHHQDNVFYQPDFRQLPEWLSPQLQSGDLVLFLGAGNLNQIIAVFFQESFPE